VQPILEVKKQMKSFVAYPLADYLAHQPELERAVREVLTSGQYILGQEVAAFEAEFAAYVGAEQAVGVANGTDAIELILRGLGIGPGDRVVVPSHTAVASAAGVVRAGATPVFVDVDEETMTLCPTALSEVLGGVQGARVRAVLAVHLYGHPCDMKQLAALCEGAGVTLIEDGAQAHGALYEGSNVGTLARAAAFSFYPTKNLGAVGDGGAITTSDAELAERIRRLRQYGWVGRYVSETVGINSRLDELQAAMLRVKLRTLPAQLAARQKWAGWYGEQLNGMAGLQLPTVQPDCGHAWHLYVVRSKEREALMEHLRGLEIPVGVHYPVPIHLQPGYVAFAQQSPALPVTEGLAKEVLSLPLHPYMQEEELQQVVEGVQSWPGGKGDD